MMITFGSHYLQLFVQRISLLYDTNSVQMPARAEAPEIFQSHLLQLHLLLERFGLQLAILLRLFHSRIMSLLFILNEAILVPELAANLIIVLLELLH